MKKTIIAIAAALTAVFGTSAAAVYTHTLVINKSDGTKVEYKFEDIPVAEILGDELKITVGLTGESVIHPIVGMVNMTFDKQELGGIGLVPVGDPGAVSFGISREALDVAGLAAGCDVMIYDVAGVLVAVGKAGVDGSVSVPLSGLGNGIYIVSAGKATFKFTR